MVNCKRNGYEKKDLFLYTLLLLMSSFFLIIDPIFQYFSFVGLAIRSSVNTSRCSEQL